MNKLKQDRHRLTRGEIASYVYNLQKSQVEDLASFVGYGSGTALKNYLRYNVEMPLSEDKELKVIEWFECIGMPITYGETIEEFRSDIVIGEWVDYTLQVVSSMEDIERLNLMRSKLEYLNQVLEHQINYVESVDNFRK